jgi:uncharacterized protein YjbJ (UPF0337 family)
VAAMDNMENGKDKVVGKIKETAGKMMNSDEMEFKGKMQTMKSGIGDRMEDMKDGVLHKANEIIDKVKGNKKDEHF